MARTATSILDNFGKPCERCGKDTQVKIMSRFNTEIICRECEEKERAHPDYEKAMKEEEAQVRAGNRNYEGIGLPPDLR